MLELEATLRQRLARLPFAAQVAFGAACAHQFYSIVGQYTAWAKNESDIGRLMDQLWRAAEAESLHDVDENLYDDLGNEIPDEGTLPPTSLALVEYAYTCAMSAFGMLIGTESNGASDAALCIWESVLLMEGQDKQEARLKEQILLQDEYLNQLEEWTEKRNHSLLASIKATAQASCLPYSLEFFSP